MLTPQKQLDAFLKKYDPGITKLAKAALAFMRRRLPGAVEMVYDNYNALVSGFGPTAKPSQAILSVAVYPKWVNVYFFKGAELMDPGRQLRGKGSMIRHVRLNSVADLDDPGIDALIEQSVELATPNFDTKQKRQLIIKCIAARQRPRRPSTQK